MIIASAMHWRAFKRNNEVYNALHKTLTSYVFQRRASIANKEEDKVL